MPFDIPFRNAKEMYAVAEVRIRDQVSRVERAVIFDVVAVRITLFNRKRQAAQICYVSLKVPQLSERLILRRERRWVQPK
jgi:hypothetical protein